MLRSAIVMTVVFGAGTARAEMLFTTLQAQGGWGGGPAPLQIEDLTVRIRMTGEGVMTLPSSYWEIPLSTDAIGQTFIGNEATLGTTRYLNFNHGLTSGTAHMFGLYTEVVVDGGGTSGRIFTKPEMFQDDLPAIDSNFAPPNGIDMRGYHLTRFELEILNATASGNSASAQFELRIFGEEGAIPEPSAGILLIVGTLFHYHAPNWRTYRRRVV